MKTSLLPLASLLLVLAGSLPGQPARATRPRPTALAPRALTPDEQLFTGLIEQVGAAIGKGDMAALGRYMTPDYVHYTPDNNTANRTAELAYVGAWSNTAVKVISPVKVTRHGDMAVTVATSSFSGVFENKPFKSDVQMMIAWVLRDGRWQMAVIQSKAISG